MSLYYQDDYVTLYHGDCLTEHREWLDADVLITDPPYGRAWKQGALKGHPRNEQSAGIANDETTGVRDEALHAWGKTRPAIAFGDLMLAPPANTKHVLIYLKDNVAGLRGAIGGIRRDTEAIYLLGKWPSGIGGRSSVFPTEQKISGAHGAVAKAGGHPHTKPGDVMGALINLTAGSIADPFAGGGSTAVTAKLLGRKIIAVELEEKYCEIIAKRCSQEVLGIFGAA